jgi:hypothetical protein
VVQVLARIGIAINRHDSTMTGSFSVQFVKIFRVVSQQCPLERLGEIEHFRIGCSIPAELADGYHIVSVAAQNVELYASFGVEPAPLSMCSGLEFRDSQANRGGSTFAATRRSGM